MAAPFLCGYLSSTKICGLRPTHFYNDALVSCASEIATFQVLDDKLQTMCVLISAALADCNLEAARAPKRPLRECMMSRPVTTRPASISRETVCMCAVLACTGKLGASGRSVAVRARHRPRRGIPPVGDV